MKRTVAILQSNYIPWKGYFDLMASADEFILYDDVQYTKNDWRNRNRIKTQNGLLWLTLPVQISGKFGQKIKDAELSSDDWRKKHWNSISQSYAKAPYFREYKARFEQLYLSSNERNLSRINFAFIRLVCEILGISSRLTWSMDYELPEADENPDAQTQRLISFCKELKATEYISGPAAKSYLNETAFAQEKIALKYMDYSGYPEYPQLYPPFEHAVSVLDLIFNVGPKSAEFMKCIGRS